jgi:predicted transcriptional regulator
MSDTTSSVPGNGSISPSVELDPEMVLELQRIADARGITLADVVREALSTEVFLVALHEDGYHILVADKTDERKILARLMQPGARKPR